MSDSKKTQKEELRVVRYAHGQSTPVADKQLALHAVLDEFRDRINEAVDCGDTPGTRSYLDVVNACLMGAARKLFLITSMIKEKEQGS